MRFPIFLPCLVLAACISDPNDNGETGPRPGHEACMNESAVEAQQDAQGVTNGNRVGNAMAGSVGAVFTAPLCLLLHP